MQIKDLAISASEMGDVLGLTDRRIRQLAEEGVFDRVERGKYPLAASVQAYIALQQTDDDDELRAEKIKLMRVQRRRIELDNEAREATGAQLDFQEVIIDAVTTFWFLSARNVSTWLFEFLNGTPKESIEAKVIAGEVHSWLIGLRHQNEMELKGAAAEARRRGISITGYDTLFRLAGKAPIAESGEGDE